MADLGAWKSLQEAVVAGSAQADRLAARVMRAESTDAGRAELLGKLIQASKQRTGRSSLRRWGHRRTGCVCVCVFFVGLSFFDVLQRS